MEIYFLYIDELIREDNESRTKELLFKLDADRQEKVLSAKLPRAKAAELGAGLLLQKAAQDWQKQKTNYGADRGPSLEESPDGVFYTVTELASQLAEPLALTYRYGEQGKPYFREIPLFFSLSHSGEYVLCAVSCREIGADIQKLQPAEVWKLAKRFYAESECLALEQCISEEERRRLFFALWSRKEAYGKLMGTGVAAVLGEDMGSKAAPPDIEWAAVSPPEGYTMAVCVRRENSV